MVILKRVLKSFFMGSFLAALSVLFFFHYPQQQKPSYFTNITSAHYSASDKQAINRSRGSAVQVFSLNENNLASLSGTYFQFGSEFYILTSAHGIIGECELIRVTHFLEQIPCEKIMFVDIERDYAVFRVPEMKTRKAIKIPRALANPKKSYKLLDKVYYTGYPNSIGPTTWTGTISGTLGDYIILQSYAWSGSSGAGVFDEKGELIGIIMALDVGQTQMGPQVLENFVIIVPIWHIEWYKIFME
jgi:S1-C subfamily serine protease